MEDVFKNKWEIYDKYISNYLKQAYRDTCSAAGSQASVIVAGYPQLFEEKVKSLLISLSESKIINTNVTKFNKEIEDIINELRNNENKNIYFVSVEDEFAGHGTHASSSFINGIILPAQSQDIDQTSVSAYSVHPNGKGTDAYAEAVQQMIDQLEDERSRNKSKTPKSSESTNATTRDIALVLDTSGSMVGEPLTEVKRATTNFTDTVLETDSNVGLIKFEGEAEVMQPLTNNSSLIATAANNLVVGGGTNIGAGLTRAKTMLTNSSANRKIIIIMTDGESNSGMNADELINYAEKLRNEGYYIYTLGFFSGLSSENKASAQHLLEQIASEGCHYEVTEASDLQFFFGDIADQINGVRYNYIRIACPVDVSVTSNGETLTSANSSNRARTSFGTLTYENAQTDDNRNSEGENAVKVLRLREGPEYEVSINGTGTGAMNYTIGFVDDDGEYSDMRYFDEIEINPKTKISTLAKDTYATRMSLDSNGDGRVDVTYVAQAKSHAVEVDSSWVIQIETIVAAIISACIVALFIRALKQIRRSK